MNILLVHNYYQQPGGEDVAFATEAAILRAHGHQVTLYQLHNDQIASIGRLALARATIWSQDSYTAIRSIIRQEQIQIVHFHNTLPLVSPSAYYAAQREGTPVVQTLHNFRLLCPAATFFRAGATCELCLDRLLPFPAIRHACYRQSRGATAVMSAMLSFHRLIGTYQDAVSAYIVLTEFARQKFISGGLAPQKLFLKPNCLCDDPGPGAGNGNFAVYIGRLSPEKGIATLLKAWRSLKEIRLKIAGDGPLAALVTAEAAENPNIEWLGRIDGAGVRQLLGDARLVVFPSECYEGLPFTIIEAFSRGTPVVASDHGSMTSLIRSGATGFLFEPGSPAKLVEAVRLAWTDHGRLASMRTAVREEFERNYTAETNYRRMLEIYDRALAGPARSDAAVSGG